MDLNEDIFDDLDVDLNYFNRLYPNFDDNLRNQYYDIESEILLKMKMISPY